VRAKPSLFRLTAAAAISGLLIGPGLAQTVQAQPVPPAGAATPAVDPPSRVGRLARLQGTVSFHAVDADQWEAATLNYPVTSGNAFWTEPGAAAEIEIGASQIAFDQASEFDIATLDDHALVATEGQGAAYLRLRNVPEGDSYTINTPRGSVTIAAAGRYEVVAGDTDNPTRITVVEGVAQIASGTLALEVHAQQTATLTGTDTFDGSVDAEADDAFLTAQLALEQPVAPARPVAYTPPAVVQQMTGSDAVVETGEWVATPQYGHVWYPPVQADWVPYRHGHWAYVAPWGWTWVDDASWGFAPFHYGRWVQIDHRWGWDPVDESAPVVVGERPVYAPALVSFMDVGASVAVGAAVGFAAGAGFGGSIGWIPLGPREVYRPPYHVSDRYMRQVNVTNVRNETNITNVRNTTINNFANRDAATVVSRATMTGSQPVAGHAVRVTQQTLAGAHPVAQASVQPTLATRGVTPAVAQRLHLAAAPGGTAPVRAAAPAGAHPGLPVLVTPHAGAGTPAAAGVKPGAAPGPAIAPHAAGAVAGQPATPGVGTHPGLPALAPAHGSTSAPAAAEVKPGAVPGSAIAPHAAGAVAGQPATPGVGTHPGLPALAPAHVGTGAPAATVASPAVANPPAAAHVAPAPTSTVVQPHAPAATTPSVLQIHAAPHVVAPVVPPAAPAPVVQPHAAPVVQPHAAPVVQPHAAPVVQPHAAPVVQPHVSAPPAPHPAAAPVRKVCPAGHPNC